MRQLLRMLFRGLLGLTVVTVMGAAVQAEAGPPPERWASDPPCVNRGEAPADQHDWTQGLPAMQAPHPGAFLLASDDGPVKEKPAAPAPTPKKPKARRAIEAPSPQMERHDSKSAGFGDEPERAGTKKIGGQVIRAKEAPGGE